ncbi:MAG: hypothetical protein LBP59_13185 [Planctomycetaceae bacterium]|nr:hypothetical protein [Planctomycetaceae bacterium]
MYSTANDRGLISQPPFCLPCGKVQARRPRSVGLACISGSLASRLGSFRFAGGTSTILLSFLFCCFVLIFPIAFISVTITISRFRE